MVKSSEIIAIFNLRHPQASVYQEYVEKYRDKYTVVDAAGGEGFASVVLTGDTLYLSPISSITLKKRLEAVFGSDAAYTDF